MLVTPQNNNDGYLLFICVLLNFYSFRSNILRSAYGLVFFVLFLFFLGVFIPATFRAIFFARVFVAIATFNWNIAINMKKDPYFWPPLDSLPDVFNRHLIFSANGIVIFETIKCELPLGADTQNIRPLLSAYVFLIK